MNLSVYSNYKVLILVDRNQKSIKNFFSVRGFNVLDPAAKGGYLKQVLNEKPHIVIMDLFGDGLNANEFCRKLYSINPNLQSKILVVSGLRDRTNIMGAIESGASDYILFPFDNDDLLSRVKYHLRKIKIIESGEMVDVLHDERIETIFGVLNLLSRGLDAHETLYNILFRVEKIIPVERCNIIAGGQFTDTGFVAATNDDPKFEGFKLDLSKYPEVQQVLHTGKAIVIEDIANDPIMKDVKKELKSIDFNSLMVAPISFKNVVIGVLSVKARKDVQLFSSEDIKICQLLAISSAPVLNRWRFQNGKLIFES